MNNNVYDYRVREASMTCLHDLTMMVVNKDLYDYRVREASMTCLHDLTMMVVNKDPSILSHQM